MTVSTSSTRRTGTGGPAPAPASQPQPRRIGWGQRMSRFDLKVSPYLYISPFFLLFGIFGLAPLLYTAYVAVHQWHPIGGKGEFVGLDNFTAVLQQDQFWNAVGNTFSIFVLSTVPQLVVAMFIAAVLDSNLRAGTFWRMGVLLPYIVAPVSVALIFSNLFAEQFGIINTLLGYVGVDPIPWTSDVVPSHIAIATMVNFRWTGYNTLILLAAMQAVPRDLYEAATIDGAGRVRQFFSVTVPMLKATITFVVITSTIGGLQIFDEARMFGPGGSGSGRGGPDGQWKTITLYLWEVGWNSANFGRAAAIAWLLFLLILLVGVVNFLLTRRISSQGDAR